MPAPQGLDGDARSEADLSVNERQYFGADLDRIDDYPIAIDPDDPRTAFRHSYVYQSLFPIHTQTDGSEFGGIQLRARCHTLAPEAPERLKKWLVEVAHRAAFIFNSGIEARRYGPQTNTRGTTDGDGYLDGFNSKKHDSYHNTEQEAVAQLDTQPGVIDWSVEVYTDDEFDYADLSGIAQGVTSPYTVEERDVPGSPAVDVAPTKWEITWNQSKDGGSYDIHPKGDTNARKRYQTGAGQGKTVYVNGKPIGQLDKEGRTWLAPEYAGSNPNTASGSWGTYYSREGLVDETDATYQSLRKRGRLYQTGETGEAVYLATARAKPEGWTEADPDDVSVDLEAEAGVEPATWTELVLRDPGDQREERDGPAVPVECRRDYERIKHLGLSDPRYSHQLHGGQRWQN